MADRREQRATQRYLGRCNYEGTLHEEKGGCVDWVPDLNEPIVESSPGAAEGATAQPTLPIQLNAEQEKCVQIWAADDRCWTTQETVAFNLRTFARKILGEAGVAATVETPPDWRSLLSEIDKWCSGENQVDDGEDAEDALRYIQDAIKAFLASETLQPASEPTEKQK